MGCHRGYYRGGCRPEARTSTSRRRQLNLLAALRLSIVDFHLQPGDAALQVSSAILRLELGFHLAVDHYAVASETAPEPMPEPERTCTPPKTGKPTQMKTGARALASLLRNDGSCAVGATQPVNQRSLRFRRCRRSGLHLGLSRKLCPLRGKAKPFLVIGARARIEALSIAYAGPVSAALPVPLAPGPTSPTQQQAPARPL